MVITNGLLRPNVGRWEATNGETAEDSTVVRMLLCHRCLRPIVEEAEIIRMRQASVAEDSVFCYALDLFSDDQPVCAYLAQESDSSRFDLVCARPHAPVIVWSTNLASNLRVGDPIPTLQFLHRPNRRCRSFFNGYAARSVHCIFCEEFIGWHCRRMFREPLPSAGMHAIRQLNGSSTESAEDFVAIVVTRCTWDEGPRWSFVPGLLCLARGEEGGAWNFYDDGSETEAIDQHHYTTSDNSTMNSEVHDVDNPGDPA